MTILTHLEVNILPFLKKKPVSGLIVSSRTPDQKPDSDDQELDMHASNLIDAIHSKDIKRTVEALKNAFDCLESYSPEKEEDEDEE